MPRTRSRRNPSVTTYWYWNSFETSNRSRLSVQNPNSLSIFKNLSRNEFIYQILRFWKPKLLYKRNSYPKPLTQNLMESTRTKLFYRNLEDYQQTMLPLFMDELWCQLRKKIDEKIALNEPDIDEEFEENTSEDEYSSEDRLEIEIICMPTSNGIFREVCRFKLKKITTSYNNYLIQGNLVRILILGTDNQIFGYVASMEKVQEILEDESKIQTELIVTILTQPSFADSSKKFSFTIMSLQWLDLHLPFVDLFTHPMTIEQPFSPYFPFSKILKPNFETFHALPVEDVNWHSTLVTKEKLNYEQKKIVATITKIVEEKKPKICLIKGPPGTGKSRVIVNIVESILCRNSSSKILICAPSNKAIDELVSRLIRKTSTCILKGRKVLSNIVRVGSEKKIDKEVKCVSLIRQAVCQVMESLENSLKFSGEDDIEEMIYQKVKSYLLQDQNEDEEKKIRDEFVLSIEDFSTMLGICKITKKSSKDLDRIKNKVYDAAKEILTRANIISCTLSSCYTSSMMRNIYGKENLSQISVCIVDEATHATELLNLIPFMLGVKIMILVGDSKQLRPIVISPRASKAGFCHSFYSRIEKYFSEIENKDIINLILNTQYRMHDSIAQWPNNYFYEGIIVNKALNRPIHTCNYKIFDHSYEQREDGRLNQGESGLVIELIGILIEHFVIKKMTPSICIITPYNSQRKSLNDRLNNYEKRNAKISKAFNIKSIKAYTVDSFQGSESDIIIMSCVRSKGLGFVGDPNRLCVTLTRAKHTLVIFGNFETFKTNGTWKSLLEDAKKRNAWVDLKDKPAHIKVKLMKEHMFGNRL